MSGAVYGSLARVGSLTLPYSAMRSCPHTQWKSIALRESFWSASFLCSLRLRCLTQRHKDQRWVFRRM